MNESRRLPHVKHVKESTVTMDAGEMRCDASSSPTPDPSCVVRAPIGLLAELTHRCPLQCPYCSNPLELEKVNTELTTAEWQNVMRQAAQLGILQMHLSGGEPTARHDLEEIVKAAAEIGLYTNLITAARAAEARPAGEAEGRAASITCRSPSRTSTRRPRTPTASPATRAAAPRRSEVGRLGARARHAADHQRADPSPQHQERAKPSSTIAVELGAGRVEIAHVQYYAWALKNRASLMPTREAFMDAARIVERERERLKGIIVIDCRRAGLLRQVPQALHGRLGQGHHQHHAVGSRAALPRGGIDHAPSVRQRARQDARATSGSTARPSRSIAAPSG